MSKTIKLSGLDKLIYIYFLMAFKINLLMLKVI